MGGTRPSVAFVFLLLACTGLAAPVRAQTVVGTVLERATHQPLAGAFVQLEDPEGQRLGGVLTGEDGTFVLRAPAPGRYSVVADLIGYAGARSAPLELEAGVGTPITLRVPVEAVSLEGITAEVGERCRPRPGSGPATARLWEEARKALRVARWADEHDVLQFQVAEHVREIDAESQQILSHRETGRAGYYDESPFASVDAERLHEAGYVQAGPDDTWDYYAPDAGVLLSESFLDTHCFRVVDPVEPDGYVGLGFEPVRGRDVPEIEGVLWLDPGTAELRTLEFRYVQLPFRHGRWDQVGGRVQFERLATGMWIVRRWRIRMPFRATETTPPGVPGATARLELVSLLQHGAEVRSVRLRDGTLLSETTGGTVHGVVTGPSGAPLPDATVEIAAAHRRTRSGPDGGYRIGQVPPGTWAVRVGHPVAGSLGIGPMEERVEVVGGQAVRVPLALKLSRERLRGLCEAAAAPGSDPVLVYGRVRGVADRPVPGGLVRVRSGGSERRVLTDSLGAYHVCLPGGSVDIKAVAVTPRSATTDLDALDPVTLGASPTGVVRGDLTLSDAGPVRVAGADGAVRSSLAGRVLDEGTGDPVPGATVELRGPADAVIASRVSDADGGFRFSHPGQGDRFSLRVSHVGFQASRGGIRFPAGDRIQLEVLLSQRAIELEPIVVRQRRRGALVAVGFYERAEQGNGVFIDREEIERRRPRLITDLIRGRAGFRVVDLLSGGADVQLSQHVSFEVDPCLPAVWVDGTLRREGGAGSVYVTATGRVPRDPLTDLIYPEAVEGMELYAHRSGVPPEYQGANSPCGVIVVWTRPGLP